MTFTKTIMILASAGFLAACEAGVSTSGGSSMAMSGGVDAATIRDGSLTGKLDGASMSGDAVVYAYYTDVIGDGAVLNGADAYCGGPGQAVIQLTRGEKGGRGYNSMAFTCR
ncbi:MAG: hypothetical protein COB08_009550 [Rhodobacteraceae bacterium]|nr:hypothetical protein [Paracoccaceae bacterium]